MPLLFFCLQNTILSCSEQLYLICSFQAGKTLSARKWQAAFSPDGCLDIASVLSRIQRGVRFLSFTYAPCPTYVHICVMFI